jgi:hypothetical protein
LGNLNQVGTSEVNIVTSTKSNRNIGFGQSSRVIVTIGY